MDPLERIKEQVENNPILIYMKGTPQFPQCGFSSRAAAAVAFHRTADRGENGLQGLALRLCAAERVPGVDAIEFQRFGVQVGPLEWLHVTVRQLPGLEAPSVVHLDDHRGDLQQGVASGIETGGFHVHHHRQVAPEALVDGRMHLRPVHGDQG